MAIFFVWLLLAAFVMLVVGLISPKTARFWKRDGEVTRVQITSIYLIAIVIAVYGIIRSPFPEVKPKTLEEELKEAENAPAEPRNQFAYSTWYSDELEYSWKADIPNNIVLSFLEDSVEFNLPGGDGLLAGDLLKKRSPTTPKRMMLRYKVKGNEVILDPGLFGYDIHMEISGDTLIWKGGRPINQDHISLRKTGPVKRLK